MRWLSLGNNIFPFLLTISLYSCFYFGTLEEYYVGFLKLPPGNMVSDGSCFLLLLYFITGCTGSWILSVRLFNIEILGIVGIREITLAQFFVGLAVINSVFTVLIK
jgi:hypothetical protein